MNTLQPFLLSSELSSPELTRQEATQFLDYLSRHGWMPTDVLAAFSPEWNQDLLTQRPELRKTLNNLVLRLQRSGIIPQPPLVFSQRIREMHDRTRHLLSQ